MKENWLGEIDFLLCHNARYTNDKRFLNGYINDFTCSFCHSISEDIFHMLIDCDFTRNLFRLVYDICQTILSIGIPIDRFICYTLFGYPTAKPKDVYNLVNFVLSFYRCTIWSARKWINLGQNINLRLIFRSMIHKRIEIEFKKHTWSNSVSSFFRIFGVNEALIYPINSGYNLAFS